MSFLNKVKKGIQMRSQIHVLMGPNGVGKTTWAASFPDVLLVDLEHGSFHVDCERVSDFKTFDQFFSFLKEFLTASHEYKALAIDSAEALEGLVLDFVCKEGGVNNIEAYGGGFGKGFTRSREIVREVMMLLREIQSKRDVTIIIVAHTAIKTMADPTDNSSYDRYIMRCNDKSAAIIKDLADNVFFCTHKTYVTKTKNKTTATSLGERVMYTEWRTSHDAKNRLSLPYELPLSYQAFKEACDKSSKLKAPDISTEIEELLTKIKDEQLLVRVKNAVESAGNNPQELSRIKTKLLTVVETH